MQFLKLEPLQAAYSRKSSNEMWRNYWRQTISESISQETLSQIFDVIQSDVVLQKQAH